MSEEKTNKESENRPMDLGADSTLALYELFDWCGKNKPKVFLGLALVAAVFLAIYGSNEMAHTKQVNASKALALVMDKYSGVDSEETPSGKDFLAVATEHPGTHAAARATILAGKYFFEDGDYEQALNAFKGFDTAYPDSLQVMKENAVFGAARSEEALGNLDEALKLYQSLDGAYQSSLNEATTFAAARIHLAKEDYKTSYQLFDKLSIGSGFSYQTRQAAVLKQEIIKIDPSVKPAVSASSETDAEDVATDPAPPAE